MVTPQRPPPAVDAVGDDPPVAVPVAVRRDLDRRGDRVAVDLDQPRAVRQRQDGGRRLRVHRIADQQQPDQRREGVTFVGQRRPRRHAVVARECGNCRRTDSLHDAVDRVRRTAQRVRDALRRVVRE